VYINNIKFRLKSIPLMNILKEEYRIALEDYIRNSIGVIIKEGENYTDVPYDLWEYLLIHNLGRHYTFLNLLGIRSFREERNIVLDNDIFDFYLSLPVELKLNSKILSKALIILNKDLARVENANHNMPAFYSPWQLTVTNAQNFLLNKLGFNFKRPPKPEERSWPLLSQLLESKFFIDKIERLKESERLGNLKIFDLGKISFYIETHLTGRDDHSDLLTSLLTVDEFLKN